MTANKTGMNVYVSWEKLRFEVPDPDDKNATKVILDNLNGHVLPGELVAVIGPSGSGKSSFLNCIAGRNVNGVTGNLLFNGVPRPSNFARFTGYVVQDDLYLASLTVKETLTFAANLKLPTSMPKEDRRLRVQSILEELDLVKCQDTQIGTIGAGISGGERRRLAIGLEIINEPSLLMLDEPTTGLDSASALMVGKILQRLCAKGITILCTIHQPRYALATMFDKVYFLAKGQEIYFGPTVPHCLSFFENAGYKCPPFTNPADFLLDLVNTAMEEDGGDSNEFSNDTENETVNLVSHNDTKTKGKPETEMIETQKTEKEENNNDNNNNNKNTDESAIAGISKTDNVDKEKEAIREEEKNNNEAQDQAVKDLKKKNKSDDDDDEDEDSDGFLNDMLGYASGDSDHEIDQDFKKHILQKSKDIDKEEEQAKAKEKEKEKEKTIEEEADVAKDKSDKKSNETGGKEDERQRSPSPVAFSHKHGRVLSRDEIIEHLTQEYQNSSYRMKALEFSIPDDENGAIIFEQLAKDFYITGWFNQFKVVLIRSFLHKAREPIALMTQVFNSLVIPLIFGSMYWQIDESQQSSLDRVSAISLVVIMLSFFAYDILLLFPLERDIFNREQQAGMYRPSAFYFGRSLAEMPQHVILMGIMGIITYWMYGLQPDAAKFLTWLVLFELTGICAASLLLSFGAWAANMEQSNLLATFFLLLFMLFDGNWISIDKVPIYWKWVQYISLFGYGTQGLIVNEYRGLELDCTNEEIELGECFYLTGEDVLDDRGLDNVKISDCIIYLIVLTIGFRIIAFIGVLFLFRPKPPKQIFRELFFDVTIKSQEMESNDHE